MSTALKGPWSLCYDGVIEDAEGGTVIGFPFDSYREFNEQPDFDKAKQRAIAAVPELLAALNAMLEYTADLNANQGMGDDHPAVNQASAAVAKATGGAA